MAKYNTHTGSNGQVWDTISHDDHYVPIQGPMAKYGTQSAKMTIM